jgi:hypothetical protein
LKEQVRVDFICTRLEAGPTMPFTPEWNIDMRMKGY